jgi:hypothetical protein
MGANAGRGIEVLPVNAVLLLPCLRGYCLSRVLRCVLFLFYLAAWESTLYQGRTE